MVRYLLFRRRINSAVECYLHTVEVTGSNPVFSTRNPECESVRDFFFFTIPRRLCRCGVAKPGAFPEWNPTSGGRFPPKPPSPTFPSLSGSRHHPYPHRPPAESLFRHPSPAGKGRAASSPEISERPVRPKGFDRPFCILYPFGDRTSPEPAVQGTCAFGPTVTPPPAGRSSLPSPTRSTGRSPLHRPSPRRPGRWSSLRRSPFPGSPPDPRR